jgi:hypothetical protein
MALLISTGTTNVPPKFLFGESYGTARTCVLAWMLHEDGIDLNGVTLQSSVLDYPANFSNAPGLMPTYAADAWYHQKTGIHPPPPYTTATQFSFTTDEEHRAMPALARFGVHQHPGRPQGLPFERVEDVVAKLERAHTRTRPAYVIVDPIAFSSPA